MAVFLIRRTAFVVLLALVGIGIVFRTHGFAPAVAGESAKPPAGLSAKAFDGVDFHGVFGVEAERDPQKEVFSFKEGKFFSASCLKWGFTPAPYWTRRDDKGVHFLAELESAEHGTMRYEGTFDGKELTAVAYWKKERWYWTIERTYRFKGRPGKIAK
ncbi:MAG: hypothetical protein R3229_02055 [Alphaproteobacteria bacterium]|nr:hypothetical protein [Alphaproteobacteria bacterium]